MPPVSKRRKKYEDDEPVGGNAGYIPPAPTAAEALARVVLQHGRAKNPWPDKAFLSEVAHERQDGLTPSLPTFDVLPPGPELRRLRESVEVDAHKVANLLGVAPSYLANIESGAAVFDDSCMEKERGGVKAAERLYTGIAEWLRSNNNQKEETNGNA